MEVLQAIMLVIDLLSLVVCLATDCGVNNVWKIPNQCWRVCWDTHSCLRPRTKLRLHHGID